LNASLVGRVPESSFLLPALGFAQQYSIDWYKIAGGGGTSSGGTYSVNGTIGQPEASGAMSGGNFSVTGGFWSLVGVVQSVGAPTLTVTRSGKSVIVSWPSSATGFGLQQKSNLAAANWSTSGYTISDDGTNKSINVASPAGNLFFRLSHP
jgi:hypothetical protein